MEIQTQRGGYMPVYQINYKIMEETDASDKALLEYLNTDPDINNNFGKHSIEVYSGQWLILCSSPIDVVQQTLENIAGKDIIITVTEVHKDSYRLSPNNGNFNAVISWLEWHPCRKKA